MARTKKVVAPDPAAWAEEARQALEAAKGRAEVAAERVAKGQVALDEAKSEQDAAERDVATAQDLVDALAKVAPAPSNGVAQVVAPEGVESQETVGTV